MKRGMVSTRNKRIREKDFGEESGDYRNVMKKESSGVHRLKMEDGQKEYHGRKGV